MVRFRNDTVKQKSGCVGEDGLCVCRVLPIVFETMDECIIISDVLVVCYESHFLRVRNRRDEHCTT